MAEQRPLQRPRLLQRSLLRLCRSAVCAGRVRRGGKRGGAGKRGGGGEQARRSGGGGGGSARAARAAEGRRGGGATAAVDTCWRVARVGGGRGWLFSAHRLRARALVQLQAGPSARSFVRGRSTPWSHLRGIVYDDRPHDSPGALSAARLPTRAHNYAHGSPEQNLVRMTPPIPQNAHGSPGTPFVTRLPRRPGSAHGSPGARARLPTHPSTC